jgi:hypothetical protein
LPSNVVMSALRLSVVGVVLGLIGAMQLRALLDKLLFGITLRDPLTFIAVPAFLMAIAVLASLTP